MACLTSYIFLMFGGQSIRANGYWTDRCTKNNSDEVNDTYNQCDMIGQYFEGFGQQIFFQMYPKNLVTFNKLSPMLGDAIS